MDISQHQLDYARQHIAEKSVTFLHSDGDRLPVADQTCDAVFSVHVFQHFEAKEDVLGVFRDVHRILKPGGTLLVHLPLYNLPDSAVAKLFPPIISLTQCLGRMRAALIRRQLRQGRWKFLMRRLRLDRNQLIKDLQGMGFGRIETRYFPVRSNQQYHEVIFATK